MREVIAKRRLWPHELQELVFVLDKSRSNSALNLPSELASDQQTFEQCEGNSINAFAAPDTPRARQALLGPVDPDMHSITLAQCCEREDLLIARIVEMAQRRPNVAPRLRDLRKRGLPGINGHVLSRVMSEFRTHEAPTANLNLIDDDKLPPVPRDVQDQFEDTSIERQPHKPDRDVFSLQAQTSNEMRPQLLEIVFEDRKRQKSAFIILGEIEVWRLDLGKPADEPRHPDLATGYPWPSDGPNLLKCSGRRIPLARQSVSSISIRRRLTGSSASCVLETSPIRPSICASTPLGVRPSATYVRRRRRVSNFHSYFRLAAIWEIASFRELRL